MATDNSRPKRKCHLIAKRKLKTMNDPKSTLAIYCNDLPFYDDCYFADSYDATNGDSFHGDPILCSIPQRDPLWHSWGSYVILFVDCINLLLDNKKYRQHCKSKIEKYPFIAEVYQLYQQHPEYKQKQQKRRANKQKKNVQDTMEEKTDQNHSDLDVKVYYIFVIQIQLVTMNVFRNSLKWS